MKPTMKIINGKTCVRLIDLAHAWDTTTSNILCTSKPYHIPEKYLHRIDGRIWCELEGLRYRSTATSKSRLTRHIVEFLDSLKKTTAEPEPTVTKAEPQALDPATKRWITNSGHLATQAFAEAKEAAEKAGGARHVADNNTKRIGWLETRINSIFADTRDNTKLIDEHSVRLYHLENTVSKLKSCDHVASATVVSDKNTERINDLTTRVHDLDVRAKAVEHDIPQLLHAMCPKERVQELSGKLDGLADVVDDNQVEITNAKSFLNNLDHRTADTAAKAYAAHDLANKALDTATQAADLAQENADIVSGEIERLTKQKERIDKMEKLHDEDAVSVAASVGEIKRTQRDLEGRIGTQLERDQRDLEDRIGTLDKRMRTIDWTLAAVAVLGVVGHVLRLLRRR